MRTRTPAVDRRGPRGIGLIDALVALAILSFGLLALTRLQARTVAQATESQDRATAMRFGDELLNLALVDPANAACYTLPVDGACANATAKGRAADWKTRALAALPGTPSATAALGVDGRLTVTLTWKGKESQETRTLVAVTDVRI